MILHWLQPSFDGKGADPSTVHLERAKLREPGTCEWMTACTYWHDWLRGGAPSPGSGHRRFLWVHGLPGSGKTILASRLNDEVALHCGAARGCSYYYCLAEHARDETESFLRHAVRDFCIQLGGFVPPRLHDMWRHQKFGIDDLVECLRVITHEFLARGGAGGRAYLIVDAVDESPAPRKTFLDVLARIGTDPAFDHVSLLMTSREEPDIKQAIERLPQQASDGSSSSTFDISVQTVSRPSSNDENRLVQLPKLARLASAVPSRAISESPVSSTYSKDLIGLDIPANNNNARARSTCVGEQDVDAGAVHITSPTVATNPSAPRNNKRQLFGPQDSSLPSPQKRKVSPGGRHVEVTQPLPDHEFDDTAAAAEAHDGQVRRRALLPCSILSMANPFVEAAIEKVVARRLKKSGRFGQRPREDFLRKLSAKLARKAGGVFRAVACHLNLMARQQDMFEDDQILATIDQFPATLFEQYAQILATGITDAGSPNNSHNRDFARTALALACSNTADVPDVVILVEAARFNVPQGKAQAYNLEKTGQLLGCLVKVTPLGRRPPTLFPARDAAGPPDLLQRLAVAHFTVKEFLYRETTARGPARDFALSHETNHRLELKIVFYGLQQFLPDRKFPTQYEEYCIEMTERALGTQPAVLARDKEICEAVHRCLAWNDPHQNVVKRNKDTRGAFPTWTKLATAFAEGQAPEHRLTCVLVSLLLLEWPELAEAYLGSLDDEQKDDVWHRDYFVLRDAADDDEPPTTVLDMCVASRQLGFLDVLVGAGATFQGQEGILLRPLEHPYVDSKGDYDDGSTTGRLLRTLLERSADPNAMGELWTPLQVAVRQPEHVWVQDLLYWGADPTAVGVKHEAGHAVLDGEDPAGAGGRKWYHKTPLEICKTTKPKGVKNKSEEDWAYSRRRVEQLLTAALGNPRVIDPQGQDGGARRKAPLANTDVIMVKDD